LAGALGGLGSQGLVGREQARADEVAVAILEVVAGDLPARLRRSHGTPPCAEPTPHGQLPAPPAQVYTVRRNVAPSERQRPGHLLVADSGLRGPGRRDVLARLGRGAVGGHEVAQDARSDGPPGATQKVPRMTLVNEIRGTCRHDSQGESESP